VHTSVKQAINHARALKSFGIRYILSNHSGVLQSENKVNALKL
jgi:hypothetical protein